MKALRRRIKGRLSLAGAAIGIAITWSQALGQSTPDENFITVPEPSSLALLGVGVVGLIVLDRVTRRKK